MEKKEQPITEPDEPCRIWSKPVLREEDYSLTATGFLTEGPDMGIYS